MRGKVMKSLITPFQWALENLHLSGSSFTSLTSHRHFLSCRLQCFRNRNLQSSKMFLSEILCSSFASISFVIMLVPHSCRKSDGASHGQSQKQLTSSVVQGKWPKCERLHHQSKLEWMFLKPKERPLVSRPREGD